MASPLLTTSAVIRALAKKDAPFVRHAALRTTAVVTEEVSVPALPGVSSAAASVARAPAFPVFGAAAPRKRLTRAEQGRRARALARDPELRL